MLEFRDVSFVYTQYDMPMLHKLNFTVEDGAFVSIIGESGCGKTTIFRLINGLEKPQCGEVLVDGKPVQALKNYSAYMPQRDLLFAWRTIGANVAIPLELQKMPKHVLEDKVEEALAAVGLLEYKNKYPRDLSGGMRQRVSFARTLASGSSLLLLDEPFSALDYLTRIELQEWLLTQWQRFGKTIMFITHDVEEALFLSQKIYVINERPFSEMEQRCIPLSYPRSRADMQAPAIQELQDVLISKLRKGKRL